MNIVEELRQLEIIINEEQEKQFITYYELLIKWNSFMNLTTITEFDEVLIKHFVDSLSLIKAYDLAKESSIIDIGTGAGFPGIPLKIVYPHLQITLLDSLMKRTKFLNEVKEKLELSGLDVIHGRAEDYAKPEALREKFDLCVSRAVANLATLSEYCLPFVKTGGFFISYKSDHVTEELWSAKKAIAILGGKIENQVEFTLPGTDICRNLLVIKKSKLTPKQFPRKAGLPGKEPIA